jgi:hypothetical protein
MGKRNIIHLQIHIIMLLLSFLIGIDHRFVPIKKSELGLHILHLIYSIDSFKIIIGQGEPRVRHEQYTQIILTIANYFKRL